MLFLYCDGETAAPNEQERPPLDELDQIITNDKYAQPAKEAAKTRRGQIEGQVTWLRHPSVMHTDIHDSVYKHADTKKYSANILSRRIREAEVDQTKTKQERIEDSFKAVAEPIRHPTNPNLTPVAEWEVLPDPYMWGFSNVSVTFDSNPEKEGEIDLPEAPAEGYRKDPRASAHDETDIETEPRARRMRHSVIRVPKDDERSSMEGLRGCLLVPDPEDIPSEDPESFQTFAEQDDELYLRATREYDLTVKTFRRRRRDAANRALTAEEANKRGESLEQVDEHLLFIWDSKEKVIRFAPMQSRIECAKIPTRHSNEDVFRLRRERLPDEEDEYAEAVAEIAEEDPASAKAAISRRRLDRRKHERQQREDQREASAAASSSTNLNGNASSGGHTSRNTGINSSSHSNSAASDTGMPERLAEEQLFSGDDDDEDV